MKKICAVMLIVCMLLPNAAFASTSETNFHDEESKLQKMTDTYLGNIITSKEQVCINDETSNGQEMLFSTNNQNEDERKIKNLIEDYNRAMFLNIIGHETTMDPSFVASQELLNELNARSLYLKENYGGGKNFTSYDFDLYYEDFSIDNDVAKVIILQDVVFQTKFEDKEYPIDADFVRNEGYVLKKINGDWKLINVIFNTEGIENDALDALRKSNLSSEWTTSFDFANLKRDQYEDTKTFTDMLDDNGEINLNSLVDPYVEYSAAYDNPSLLAPTTRAGYSKSRCEEYAATYGYNINNNYCWFDYDCTNFVSQAIYHGGLAQSAHWYYNSCNDYSRSWTVVQDLRDFLMNHTLTAGYYEGPPDYPSGVGIGGTLIQYSNGSEWKHSAIIREVTDYGIYVAEHDGPSSPGNEDGNYVYHLHGTSWDNKRTFWIARGY